MDGREVKLGETLTALIERGGYSRNRQEILQAVDISAAALSQYTRDQTRPSFQKLLALASFFNVSLDYLVYGEGDLQAVPDHSPLARYIENSLAQVQTRANRHTALVGRIGRVLADRIDAVATELLESATAGREGLIQDDEAARIERFCFSADIVSLDLEFEVIDMPGDTAAAGQFLDVVARNLVRGCSYRFLIPFGSEESVEQFRSLLVERVGRDPVRQNCAFRRSGQPLVAGIAMYRLDVERLRIEEPVLFTQMADYIGADGSLGYLLRPNTATNSDMIMTKQFRERAWTTFESLWNAGVRL